MDQDVVSLSIWFNAVESACSNASAGSLAWLFSPRRVAELQAPTGTKKKLIGSRTLSVLANAGSVEPLLKRLFGQRTGHAAENVTLKSIARRFLLMMGTAYAADWPEVVEANLDIIE